MPLRVIMTLRARYYLRDDAMPPYCAILPSVASCQERRDTPLLTRMRVAFIIMVLRTLITRTCAALTRQQPLCDDAYAMSYDARSAAAGVVICCRYALRYADEADAARLLLLRWLLFYAIVLC